MALIEVLDIKPRVTVNEDGSLRIQLVAFARYGRKAPRTCSVSMEVASDEESPIAAALAALIERHRAEIEEMAEDSAMRCYHAAKDAGEEI